MAFINHKTKEVIYVSIKLKATRSKWKTYQQATEIVKSSRYVSCIQNIEPSK